MNNGVREHRRRRHARTAEATEPGERIFGDGEEGDHRQEGPVEVHRARHRGPCHRRQGQDPQDHRRRGHPRHEPAPQLRAGQPARPRGVPGRPVRAARGHRRADRRRDAAGRPVLQPRALLAGLQRPRARAGRGRVAAAARTGEVPRHLRVQSGRVLHGPRRRPEAPRRDRPAGAQRGRAHPARTARLHRQAQPGPGRAADRRVREAPAPAAGRARHPHRRLGRPLRRRPARGCPATSPSRSSRC